MVMTTGSAYNNQGDMQFANDPWNNQLDWSQQYQYGQPYQGGTSQLPPLTQGGTPGAMPGTGMDPTYQWAPNDAWAQFGTGNYQNDPGWGGNNQFDWSGAQPHIGTPWDTSASGVPQSWETAPSAGSPFSFNPWEGQWGYDPRNEQNPYYYDPWAGKWQYDAQYMPQAQNPAQFGDPDPTAQQPTAQPQATQPSDMSLLERMLTGRRNYLVGQWGEEGTGGPEGPV